MVTELGGWDVAPHRRGGNIDVSETVRLKVVSKLSLTPGRS